jgi:hypothetical protein
MSLPWPEFLDWWRIAAAIAHIMILKMKNPTAKSVE